MTEVPIRSDSCIDYPFFIWGLSVNLEVEELKVKSHGLQFTHVILLF